MFPLEQGLLPGAVVPLHIFEPRYRRLAQDVTPRPDPEFGVAVIERGREVGGDDVRADVAVVARVLHAEEFPDGRWGIAAAGTRRVRVGEWLDDAPYPRAMVEDWPDADAAVDEKILADLRHGVERIYAAARRLQPELDVPDPDLESDDPGAALWRAVLAAQLGPHDNLRLLREPGCGTRLSLAVDLVRDRADVLEALADERG